MDQKTPYTTGIDSDALRSPRRIVFLTKKTSAKVTGEPPKQVMAYPHLLLREAMTLEGLTIVLVLLALFWNAPLEQVANPLLTPNPAKAPWYFLGLQELLHYFPPVVAGILIPGLVVIALVVVPYFEVNIKGESFWAVNDRRRLLVSAAVLVSLLILLSLFEAWTVIVPTLLLGLPFLAGYSSSAQSGPARRYLHSRPLSWWVMTWFISVALTLTLVGTFFRGPGWSWVWPRR